MDKIVITKNLKKYKKGVTFNEIYIHIFRMTNTDNLC